MRLLQTETKANFTITFTIDNSRNFTVRNFVISDISLYNLGCLKCNYWLVCPKWCHLAKYLSLPFFVCIMWRHLVGHLKSFFHVECHVCRQPTLWNTGAMNFRIQKLDTKDGAVPMTSSRCRSFYDGNGQIHRREPDSVHNYLTIIWHYLTLPYLTRRAWKQEQQLSS